MPKTQLNAFKSMFLIRISSNLLIYKVDQLNQISILSFYFFHFLPQNISARSFLLFSFRNIFPHYLFITCCFRRRSSAKVPNFPLWIRKMNGIIRELTKKLFIKQLNDYVDFLSLIRVIAVLNCQNELRIARKQ